MILLNRLRRHRRRKTILYYSNGKSIAYTTADVQAMKKARKKAKPQKTGGVEIDLLNFSAFQINNNLQESRTAPSLQLFVSELN